MATDAAAGYLDLLLLAAVRSSDGHGYAVMKELHRRSHGHFDLKEGSVYPALRRLEEDGLLTSRWTTVAGRRRRIYELTRSGRSALGERTADWRRYVAAVAGVIEP